MQLWDCRANVNQTWQLDSFGQLVTGGVCMESPPGQTANFTLVYAAACTGAANQKWRVGNFGSLINLASGRCLDVPSADFSNGRHLQVYDCVGTRNQSWVGPPFAPAVGSVGWGSSSSCVDRDVVAGRAQIWTCNGLVNQTWRLAADGTLTSGGACLQLAGGLGNGALVTVGSCVYGATHQLWSRFADGRLRNVAAGRCLDLDSGNTTNGRQLIIWDCVGGPNQTWVGPA